MKNSADIYLLFRVAELARRYGLRPSEAEAEFCYVPPDGNDTGLGHFELSFCGMPADLEKRAKYEQIKASLGCPRGELVAADMSDIEDAVEKAITLAPRIRAL